MNNQARFITDEQGEQIGVLLSISEYRRLMGDTSPDPELLVGMSIEELNALSEMKLTIPDQARLDDLLARNSEGQLVAAEAQELDHLLAQIDLLSLLKARAKYTLQQRSFSLIPA